MFLVASKPSSWLSSSNIVLCTSLSPPEPPSRRDDPMESISSMKMMEGACSRAMTNSSRTIRAPGERQAGGIQVTTAVLKKQSVVEVNLLKRKHTAAHPLRWTSGPAPSQTPWWRYSRCDEQQLWRAGSFLFPGDHTAAHPAPIKWLILDPSTLGQTGTQGDQICNYIDNTDNNLRGKKLIIHPSWVKKEWYSHSGKQQISISEPIEEPYWYHVIYVSSTTLEDQELRGFRWHTGHVSVQTWEKITGSFGYSFQKEQD